MKSLRKYEGVFIFPPEEGPEASKGDEKRLEDTLQRFGGRTLERKDWGRRLLGYPVRKAREARILLWNFEMDSAQVTELRKALALDEKILKSTVVRTIEVRPPKESPKKKPHARQP
jgi:ribosomal protein S6